MCVCVCACECECVRVCVCVRVCECVGSGWVRACVGGCVCAHHCVCTGVCRSFDCVHYSCNFIYMLYCVVILLSLLLYHVDSMIMWFMPCVKANLLPQPSQPDFAV